MSHPEATHKGYNRLAAAVIYQALVDRRRGPSDRRYESARRFIEDTDMRPWLELTSIDREAFLEATQDDANLFNPRSLA